MAIPRMIAVLALVLATAACAPPAGFVALSGLSYASSGKGISDHAMSVMSERDCAVLRAVRGEQICVSLGDEDRGSLMTMIDGKPPAQSLDPANAGHSTVPAAGLPADGPVKVSTAENATQSSAGVESIYALPR